MSRRKNSCLFVRNLSDRVRYEDLEKLFGKYGRIYNIKIPLDYYSGRMKDYRDAEDAKSRLDGAQLLGREIGVEFTNGYKKTPAEMRDKEKTSKRGRSRSRGKSRSRSRSRNRRQKSYSPRRSSPVRRRRDSPKRNSRNSRSDYSRSPSQ